MNARSGRNAVCAELLPLDDALHAVRIGPHLFCNLRQLLRRLGRCPARQVVAETGASWLGHSPLVAARHGPQMRDARFEVVIRGMPRVGEAEARAAPVRATA